jgi:hypothetical protein
VDGSDQVHNTRKACKAYIAIKVHLTHLKRSRPHRAGAGFSGDRREPLPETGDPPFSLSSSYPDKPRTRRSHYRFPKPAGFPPHMSNGGTPSRTKQRRGEAATTRRRISEGHARSEAEGVTFARRRLRHQGLEPCPKGSRRTRRPSAASGGKPDPRSGGCQKKYSGQGDLCLGGWW